MAKVGIVSYGIGNTRSVENALKHNNHNVGKITSLDDFSKFDVVVLPGVGAFGKCVEKLKSHNFLESLEGVAKNGQKLIGICVGHQLCYENSEESKNAFGLGIFAGSIKHISTLPAQRFSVKMNEDQLSDLHYPNVGYRGILPVSGEVEIPLDFLKGKYYFVHSYGADAAQDKNCLAYTIYNGRKISAISKKNNLITFQFYPERSRDIGLRLLDWAVEI